MPTMPYMRSAQLTYDVPSDTLAYTQPPDFKVAQMEEPNSERVITPMPKSLVNDIDDFRFKNRIASRAEAIRQLCEIGFEMSKFVDQIIDSGTDEKAIAEIKEKLVTALFTQRVIASLPRGRLIPLD